MSTWEMVEHEPRDLSSSPPFFIPLFPGEVGTPRNHPSVFPQYWHHGPDSDIIIETTISLHFFFPSLSCGTNQPKVSLLGQPVTITPAISKKGEASRPLQVKNERWECEGVASGREDVNHGAEDLAQNSCP